MGDGGGGGGGVGWVGLWMGHGFGFGFGGMGWDTMVRNSSILIRLVIYILYNTNMFVA